MTFNRDPAPFSPPANFLDSPSPSYATVTELADEPLAYHRAGSGRTWWCPVVGVAIGAGAYALLASTFFVIVVTTRRAAGVPVDNLLEVTAENPAALFTCLGLLIGLLPAAVIGTKAASRPVASLWSIYGVLRWQNLATYVLTGSAIMGATWAVVIAADNEPHRLQIGPHGVVALVVVVMLVPAQCVAEEAVFRGLIPQTIGAWLRHPMWAYTLPIPLFVLGHRYNWVGMVDVAVFAAVCGYLTWRTNGLEAAIGWHLACNLPGLVLEALGVVGRQNPSPSPILLAISLPTAALYLAVVEWHHRRTRRRAPNQTRPHCSEESERTGHPTIGARQERSVEVIHRSGCCGGRDWSSSKDHPPRDRSAGIDRHR